MSYDFIYDDSKNIMTFAPIGLISLEEIKETYIEFDNSEFDTPEIAIIWDLRELDFSNVNTELLHKLGDLMKNNLSSHWPRPCAFVVENYISQLLTKLHTIKNRGSWIYGIFETSTEAIEWIEKTRSQL